MANMSLLSWLEAQAVMQKPSLSEVALLANRLHIVPEFLGNRAPFSDPDARRIIEPAAADLAAIGAAYLGMEAAIPHDMDLCCDADLAFHRGIVAASHNIVR